MKKWVKSSYSPVNPPFCVEVAQEGSVHIRDSKDPDGAQLSVSPAAWASFIGTFGKAKG